MIYPLDFESKLGFDQIRSRLAGYCINTLGRREVDRISFSSDFFQIKTLLSQAREFKSIRERGLPFSISNYVDPTDFYPVIAIEDSFIEAASLWEISGSLQVITGCHNFLIKEKDAFPQLFNLTDSLVPFGELIHAIRNKIDELGQVKDNASPELQRVRKKLRDETHRARKLIDLMFREALGKGMVPDGSAPVIRDGRVVIPVLSEYKRKIAGVIMDESATGQTVFMEPTEVIEANNEIRNLELEERREIVKILKNLTSLLRSHLSALKLGFEFLGRIDCLQAKTRFAIEIEADLPVLVEKQIIDWKQARHPLLVLAHKNRSPVVPLTIDLTEENRFLLVSGPNAGGKSVCLKTVGLIQYMVQCGLLVPMHEQSEVGIFHSLFLDIGDQQSIENDLSTYSSHLRNMRQFVAKANDKSLVLMDELGAGTDPNFGGGIAEAILKKLVEQGVWGVATTHYYSLKLFAENTSGIRNAAMQFDSRRLEPLFVLEIGKPGSSFAIEIARKIGLDDGIISDAQRIIGADLTGLEDLIKRVNDEKLSLSRRELEVKSKESKFNELLNRYNQLSQDLEANRKQIINKAKEEASALLKQTNKEIEKTIRHIKENSAEKKETRKVRLNLLGLEKTIKPASGDDRAIKKVPIKVGDSVRIMGQEVSGKVVSIKGVNAIVQFGDMRSSVKMEKLVKGSSGDASNLSSRKTLGLDLLSKQTHFNQTLDARGMRAEAIIPVLDQFLDDAVLLGHSSLRILHGKGEGVLRKIIREQLKRNKFVVSFGDEHIDRGGDGITTIELK